MNRVVTEAAPRALGPYSQAVAAGGTVYVSGQLGLVPETGKLAGAGIEEQLERVFLNVGAILAAGSSGLDAVVKTTVYLSNLEADFQTMNRIYAEKFSAVPGALTPPARSTVGVQCLPAGARVMLDVVALQRTALAFQGDVGLKPVAATDSTANNTVMKVVAPTERASSQANKVVVLAAPPSDQP